MDRAANDLVNEPPIGETSPAPTSADLVSEDLDLPLRKRRLIDAARAIDPLSPLRRRPFVTVATAAAIGVVAASPAAARTESLLVSRGMVSNIIRSPAVTHAAWRIALALASRLASHRGEPVPEEIPPK